MTLIAEKSNIKIELKAENNVENILGDSIRIKQLICILIDNAIKYNKENGYVKVNISHSENNIELRVEDNGIGIEEQEKDKVFDRFYRISEDRNIKGFGLGLSIAKQISEEHNAEIKVQSKKDKGTTFIVIFNRLK